MKEQAKRECERGRKGMEQRERNVYEKLLAC